MPDTYTPQEGDRVKLTVEGKVTTYTPRTGSVVIEWGPNRDHLVTHTGRYSFHNGEEGIRIEPLVEPEPYWGTGDVVQVSPYLPFLRVGRGNGGSEWKSAGTAVTADKAAAVVSEAWTKGQVKVLYRQGEVVNG